MGYYFTINTPYGVQKRKGQMSKQMKGNNIINKSNTHSRDEITTNLVGEKGITLVSLIITIVIMLILAAVTINVTLGDGGLMQQAQHAAEQTANATKSEREQIDDLVSQLNDILSGGEITGPGEDTNEIEATNTVDTNTIAPEPEPPEPLPDGTISIGDPQWQEDGTANITVSTTTPDVTIEYQIGGTDEDGWTTVEGGTITGIKNGETVYVRITDGDQASNPQEKKVEDTTAPEKADIEINPTNVLVGESITATVTHVDSGIGVDVENSKWVLTESADPIGTGADVLSQYTEKFTKHQTSGAIFSVRGSVFPPRPSFRGSRQPDGMPGSDRD